MIFVLQYAEAVRDGGWRTAKNRRCIPQAGEISASSALDTSLRSKLKSGAGFSSKTFTSQLVIDSVSYSSPFADCTSYRGQSSAPFV
jgi:hypothetical protein